MRGDAVIDGDAREYVEIEIAMPREGRFAVQERLDGGQWATRYECTSTGGTYRGTWDVGTVGKVVITEYGGTGTRGRHENVFDVWFDGIHKTL